MYDLAIIGGGPGGYVAAQRAGKAGLGVVLFEKNSLGGVCLNEGCIPTKTLLYSAKVFNYAQNGEHYGVSTSEAKADFSKIMARKNKVVKKLVAGIKASMKANNVEVINTYATIKSRDNDGIITIGASEQEFQARNLIISTGSSSVIPPIPGAENTLTNKELLELSELPQSLVIIGGGVIGMEFAAFFNTLGTKVTVIEMMPKILGPMDEEISSMLQKSCTKKGIDIHLSCKVISIIGNDVHYLNPQGEEQIVSGEKILMSVGRKANLKAFGLENLGVETGRGIIVDSQMRTNIPNVYAIGDVTGFSMLAHTASREGEVAVNAILGRQDEMSYRAIPGVVYTNPELAGVGLTEVQAEEAGIDYKVFKLPLAYSGRFVAENEREDGLCKIITNSSNQVIGCHIIGNPCSEIIQTACVAIEMGMTLEMLTKIVFPHPSVSEIIKEVAQL